MKNGDEASPSIILAGRAFSENAHILEPRYAFGSNFDYIFLSSLEPKARR